MDPLKTFEQRLLSSNLIDTTKIKTNRPAWLCPQRVPRLYRDLEAMVTIASTTNAVGTASAPTVVSPLDTRLVYQLLLTSGLPQNILAALWDQCSRTAPGVLLQHEFYQALALVAMCQKGHPPNPALLVNLPQAPLPQLAIAGYPLQLTTAVISPETPNEQAPHPAIPGPSATPSTLPLTSSTVIPPDSSSNTITQGGHMHYNNSTLTLSSTLTHTKTPSNIEVPRDDGIPLSSSDHSGTSCHLTSTDKKLHSPLANLTQQPQQLSSALNDDDDDFGDFADFQSAPLGESQPTAAPTSIVETLKPSIATVAPVDDSRQSKVSDSSSSLTCNGGSVNVSSSNLVSFDLLSNGKATDANTYQSIEDVHTQKNSTTKKPTEEVPDSKPNGSFVSIPKAKPSGTMQRPAPPTIVSSVLPSLFDSVSVQMTETVQPPSEPNPWLHYPLEQETLTPAGSKDRHTKSTTTTTKPQRESLAPVTTPQAVTANVGANPVGDLLDKSATSDDDEFNEFSDFQSAPAKRVTQEDVVDIPEKQQNTNQISDPTDKYSVFRILEPEQNQSNSDDLNSAIKDNGAPLTNGQSRTVDSEKDSCGANESGSKVDILALMKLPSMPTINLDDDLSILDSLTINTMDAAETKGSAIEQLQDLDMAYSVVDGPVATDSTVNSTTASPSKSVASNGSIGEQRGDERRLSLFSNRANYSECASLSSFELGPNTESNASTPTKGSILSLELNSPKRSPPAEVIDEDETLEWTIDGSNTVEQQQDESNPNINCGLATVRAEKAKSPEDFCWAQPPMFPPPDPTTDFSKPSSAIQDLTGLYLHGYPITQVQEGKKKLTKEQVAESWVRILGKVTAVLETATHILGNDRAVLAEVLSTPKGQGYVSSLLEVYNISQQIKKAAALFEVDGLARPLEQVENAWRRQLEDVTVALGLSVICLDHLLSPLQSSANTCAVCLLPLTLRPRVLFVDDAYHATCANFWANVLAEGLPCLKLD